MTLNEELYFEIVLKGAKTDLKKFVSFLKSGELDDFFEFSADYITYDDNFNTAEGSNETGIVLSNDDFGIEIDEFDTDEFLDIFCRAAKELEVRGQLYDIDDYEYNFKSEIGNSYYVNADAINKFNEDAEFGEEDDD